MSRKKIRKKKSKRADKNYAQLMKRQQMDKATDQIRKEAANADVFVHNS